MTGPRKPLPLDECGRPLDLGAAPAERVTGSGPPPSLLDLPDAFWPLDLPLAPGALALPAVDWWLLADVLAAEAAREQSLDLRAALTGETGRVQRERLGLIEGDDVLAAGSPAVRQVAAAVQAVRADLAAELAELFHEASDDSQPPAVRVAAWIEHGQRIEDATGDIGRAYASYQAALVIMPDHPIAVALAVDAAILLKRHGEAQRLLATNVRKIDLPSLRAARRLDLAHVTDDPRQRRSYLELAHNDDPSNATALRRLIRTIRHDGGGTPSALSELYRRLAGLAEDPITAATALQLAVVVLGSEPVPAPLLADVRAWLGRSADESAAQGLLDALAYALAGQALARHGGEPDPNYIEILARLAPLLDDTREQAIVREQIARMRWSATPLAARQSAMSDDGTLRRLQDGGGDDDVQPDPLTDDEAAAYRRLEVDLRFVRTHLPEQRWVWQALADILRATGDIPALVSHLTEWAQHQPHGAERAAILVRLGFVHEELERNLPRAAEVYELAVAEDPRSAHCLRALGSVYEKMRRWAQAAATLQRQARESTEGSERLAALRRIAAIAENELHDVDLAIATLQEIAQLDQDDVLALYQLAGLCRTHGRTPVLIGTLQLLVDRLEENTARTAILVELGEAQEFHLKQRTAAREAYERALAMTPGYTPALRALARIYRDSGDLDDLLRLHEPELDPTSDPAVLALKAGRICFEEVGDMDRAIDYLTRAYRLNPDLVPAREALLQLLSANGRVREAYDLLRAQDLPHSPALLADYHYRLGLLAETLARKDARPESDTAFVDEDRALQHYRAALAVQPLHGLASERARRLLVANRDVANLVRLLEDQSQHLSGPAKAGVLVHLARLHLAERNLDEARRTYEEAIEHTPDDAILLREYKNLLRKTGDTESLPNQRLRLARVSEDTHYKATLLVESAEVLLRSAAPEDREFAANAILGALREDPGNPYAVRLLEGLLSDPNNPLAMTDAVGARAVRAQSDGERAIFYLESAELLEQAGAVNEAQRAYRAALRAMPALAPAELGLQRVSSGAARESAAPKTKAVSVHTLMAEARDAAVRAGNSGKPADAEVALGLLGQILGRGPHYRDAIGLARALASQLPEPKPALDLLRTVFGRISDAGLRYELGVYLGEQSTRDEDALAYFTVAAQARPDGKQALRGLVRCYQQLGKEAESARVMEQLLALYDPADPSAVDLRLILAGYLARAPETLARALEHGRIVLASRGDDPRAITLMAGLLERTGQPAEAAELLDRLCARERDPDRLHELYFRRASLLAEVPGREAQALAAVERAAELGPGNRTTILLLTRLLERLGQTERVSTFLEPIRLAMLGGIGRGALNPSDIRLLAEVANRPNPALAQMSRLLVHALEPGESISLPDGFMRPASAQGLQAAFATPALRQLLFAPGELPDINDLLTCVETAMDRMFPEFTGLNGDETVPVPPNVDTGAIRNNLQQWCRLLGIEDMAMRATSINNTVAVLDEGEEPTLRLGVNLWLRGDPISWRGLGALALARRALGGGRVRSLVPVELDLMIAASFEVTKVFNAITADPDARRLRDVANNLGKNLPRRQRRPLLRVCQALSSHHFEPAATARATLTTDLRMALLLSGDVAGVLSAACLLDGFANGNIKQRIVLSRNAQDLCVWMLSDAYLALRKAVA